VSRAVLALEKVGLVECLTPDEKMDRYYRTTETGKKVAEIIEGAGSNFSGELNRSGAPIGAVDVHRNFRRERHQSKRPIPASGPLRGTAGQDGCRGNATA